VKHSVRGYMDATDFYHELGAASGGNTVYPSVGDLESFSPCVKECGVVQVEMTFVRNVRNADFSTLSSKAPSKGFQRKIIRRHIAEIKKRLARYETILENLGDRTVGAPKT
jgi:hypothetical protein